MSDWIEINPTTWIHGRKKIYRVDDEFVVSHNQVWLPGVYASFETAVEAFEYTDEEISSFNGETITLDMLRSLRPSK